jgi:hypothetical protein
VTRRILLADLAIAATVALVVVIVAPGLAAAAVFAILVIVGLVLGWVVDHLRRGRK